MAVLVKLAINMINVVLFSMLEKRTGRFSVARIFQHHIFWYRESYRKIYWVYFSVPKNVPSKIVPTEKSTGSLFERRNEYHIYCKVDRNGLSITRYIH